LYLRSLKLAGFKSFADRTRLEFEPGVSVVVGPNGSGKSNIVDAVAWVMGSQSTRTMRTERMQDVIFAGTASRPALGRAEVTLVFDNEDRLLPLDLDEVSVCRRLFRDGNSEYEINGVECRLLDIQELLYDSGVGRQQHVIVGQGQLDEILNAKADQHRQVIEEAAGILKHRLRKERAIRRLDRTDQDVLRLHDILRELKRQMRPLKRQADAAMRHGSVRDELAALRLWIGGEELRDLKRRAGDAKGLGERATDRAEASQQELLALETRLIELAESAGQTGRDLDADTAAAARLETTAERLKRIAQVAHERARAVGSRIEGAGARRRDLDEELERLDADMAESGDSERRAQQDAALRETHLRAVEDEERSLAEQESMPVEGASAMARGDLRSLEGATSRDSREMEDIDRRLEAIAAAKANDDQGIERLKDEIKSTDELISVAQQVYEDRKTVRSTVQVDWEKTERLVRSCELHRAGAMAKADALEAAAAGVANREARLHAEATDTVLGPLAKVLDVGDDIAAAFDAAVSGWGDALVVGSVDSLGDLVRQLKREGLGGLGLVASGSTAGPNAAAAIAEELGLELLVDRLGPKADRDLALALFADVLVVEGWATGWEVIRRGSGIKAVTPEGDLITPTGIRLVDPDGATPAVLESSRMAAEVAEIDEARAKTVQRTNRAAFGEAREAERVALEDLEALEARLAGVADALDRIQRSQGASKDEQARLVDRRAVLLHGGEHRERQLGQLRQRLAALEGEEAERQALWERLAKEREEVQERRGEARRAREEAAEVLGGIVERRRMIEQRLTTIRAELEDLEERPADPAELVELRDIEARSLAILGAVRIHIEALRQRQVTLRQISGEAGRQLAAARQGEADLRTTLEQAKETLANVAVEETEIRLRLERVSEDLARFADATEQEALAAQRPELLEGADPTGRADELALELRKMGPINPLAAEEYADLDERHTHISDQLGDLEASRDEVRKVVTALDQEIEGLFMAAFVEVGKNYQEFFSILFPGGKGALELTDPSKPLETGLEIKAQPMGKKVSRLSLLSGGERSLAALAFLFAVFKARPSPFYILDEVEAALDDANLRRFLRLVDEFRGSAQLMIVTHQQQTMESADVLYGVTMEPGGSSQALTKRMDEVALEV